MTQETQPWEQSCRGLRWQDMPGACKEVKLLNFALFRRGKISVEEARQDECDDAEAAARASQKPPIDPMKMPCDRARLGIVVKELREQIRASGMSQKAALKLAGLSENMLNPYSLKRNPSRARLEAFERLLEKLKGVYNPHHHGAL